jgi:spore germination cell wall hydrolase CwlJ-like protein
MANAATLELHPMQDAPIQEANTSEQQLVPSSDVRIVPLVEWKPQEIVQPLPQETPEPARFETLSDAVAAQDLSSELDQELHCLAVGVYYESKGEPLAGQLAVAEVILNRTTSGRFPRSVCSVLAQRGQFSFVRGGKIPTPPANAQWRKAMAVAQVAHKDLWESPVQNALFFHARYVSPGWKRARVGTVGNHIFYR